MRAIGMRDEDADEGDDAFDKADLLGWQGLRLH
jgi:hypothetical protein